MPILPRLELTPQWGATQSNEVVLSENRLGDGYKQIAPGSINPLKESWDVSRIALESEIRGIEASLEVLAGVDQFIWRPSDYYDDGVFYCPSWTITPYLRTKNRSQLNQADGVFQISAPFIRDLVSFGYGERSGAGSGGFEDPGYSSPVMPHPRRYVTFYVGGIGLLQFIDNAP